MNRFEKNLFEIAQAIKKCRSFFIAGHVKPDGDTIGASIALASLLSRLDKNAEIFSREEMPHYLKFLRGASKIRKANKVFKYYDCAIILECSSLERMGSLIDRNQAKVLINIDHHKVFTKFGDINYIDPKASSSSEQIFNLFKMMNMKLTQTEAEALYTGAVTDTGRFQYANTTPYCLLMASELLSAGVKPQKIFSNLYEGNRVSSLRLLGEALNTLKVASKGKITFMELPNSAFRRAGADYSETENIINYGISVEGAKAAVLFRESEEKGEIKVSMRSRGKTDVSKICKHFGGAGHKNAAGCSFKGTLAEAKRRIISYVEDNLR